MDVISQLQIDLKGKKFSDIVDDQGHQYVDLVQEGGGVLGIALLGYIHVLESVGIRFLNLGGTSAGAISTLLMAAIGDIQNPKAQKILTTTGKKDFFDFVDGPQSSQKFIQALIKNKSSLHLIWRGILAYRHIQKSQALNPGQTFLQWLIHLLESEGISTLSDLQKKRQQCTKHLFTRKGHSRAAEAIHSRIALIASDITTETKVEFPHMASLYWQNPGQVHPAEFVRASMSIPVFFEPFIVNNIPQNIEAKALWKKLAGYEGLLPDKVKLLDGGILSNFPINIFHSDKTPRCPTFGVKLGKRRQQPNKTHTLGSMLRSTFNTTRYLYDYDFLFRHPDYKHLITTIDTDGFSWIDFSLNDEAKQELFTRGMKAAEKFLRGFDWEAYKKIRRDV
jgi:NTE family protein